MAKSAHLENSLGENCWGKSEIMRRFVSCFWILLLLATPFSGQTDEWKRYKNTEGNFTVLFPGEPKDSANPIAGGMSSHTLQALKAPAIYTLVWTFIDAKQGVTETNFEVFKTSFLSKLPKCTVAADQSASPALPNYIGHEYQLTCDMPQGKITIIGTLYWGQHYSYAVMAIFSATVPQPTDVKKFVESITLIDPAK
jgi:hypothetical protein